MDEDFIVTVSDARDTNANSMNYCARGMRTWFKNADLDFGDFLENGIPASKLIATNDSLALAVVEHARKRVMEERNGQK